MGISDTGLSMGSNYRKTGTIGKFFVGKSTPVSEYDGSKDLLEGQTSGLPLKLKANFFAISGGDCILSVPSQPEFLAR